MTRRHWSAIALACMAITLALCGTAQSYDFRSIHTFCKQRLCADGIEPASSMIMDSSGNLYGVAKPSGSDASIIFELMPNADGTKWKFEIPYSTCPGLCGSIVGNLIVDNADNLYAAVSQGSGAGEAIELVARPGKIKRKLRVLYSFLVGGSEAASPSSGFTYMGAASGLPYDGVSPLYGASLLGGNNAAGTIYKLTPDGKTWTESVVYSFCSQRGSSCLDGANPKAAPTIDVAGNLYGTTSSGGNGLSRGVIYELSNGGGNWTETVLHINCQLAKCADGVPGNELLVDASGNLFGTFPGATNALAGGLFKLVPDGASSTYSVIYSFCSQPRNCRDGVSPTGALVMDSSGTLYGAATYGGGHDRDPQHAGGGTVFKFDGSTLTALYAFCAEANCIDGQYPAAGVLLDPAGNIFGTTQFGGRRGEGTVFELTP